MSDGLTNAEWLAAHLSQARREAMNEARRERAEAMARLAALLPVARAAVRWAAIRDYQSSPALLDAVAALPPDLRAELEADQ